MYREEIKGESVTLCLMVRSKCTTLRLQSLMSREEETDITVTSELSNEEEREKGCRREEKSLLIFTL